MKNLMYLLLVVALGATTMTSCKKIPHTKVAHIAGDSLKDNKYHAQGIDICDHSISTDSEQVVLRFWITLNEQVSGSGAGIFACEVLDGGVLSPQGHKYLASTHDFYFTETATTITFSGFTGNMQLIEGDASRTIYLSQLNGTYNKDEQGNVIILTNNPDGTNCPVKIWLAND